MNFISLLFFVPVSSPRQNGERLSKSCKDDSPLTIVLLRSWWHLGVPVHLWEAGGELRLTPEYVALREEGFIAKHGIWRYAKPALYPSTGDT